MVKVLNKLKKIFFPKSNPFIEQKKINVKYNSVKSEERRQSMFKYFNRVDKILTIFPSFLFLIIYSLAAFNFFGRYTRCHPYQGDFSELTLYTHDRFPHHWHPL